MVMMMKISIKTVVEEKDLLMKNGINDDSSNNNDDDEIEDYESNEKDVSISHIIWHCQIAATCNNNNNNNNNNNKTPHQKIMIIIIICHPGGPQIKIKRKWKVW